MGNYGLVVVKSNEDIDRDEQLAREQAEASQAQYESRLAAHIRTQYQRAHQAKRQTETRLLRNQRQVNGQYDEEKLAAIREMGGAEIYMMLTAVKCRAAKSWIRDVLMPAGDKPWALEPSETPEISPEVEQQIQERVIHDAQEMYAATGQMPTTQQAAEVAEQLRSQVKGQIKDQAEDQAESMADTIEGQLREGGWDDEFDWAISDIVDFGTCIIKGPVLHKSLSLQWHVDPMVGTSAVAEERISPAVARVSPFDLYPAPGVYDPQDGDLIERHELRRQDLFDMIGVPSYDEGEIRAVLQEYREHGLTDWLSQVVDASQERASKQDSNSWLNSDTIDALEYWGSVQGSLLHEWGVDEVEAPDPEAEYEINAWLVGRHVIKATINPDPMGRKPYGKATYQKMERNFWGLGVPDLIRDCQDIANASARAMVNNMGISSGPQVVANSDSMAPGEDATQIYPWKVWQVDYKKMGNSQKMPVEFFQPNPLSDALMRVYDRFSREADEQAGVPSYTHGSNQNTSGAAGTASGLSMLMNAASKAIKDVIRHLDRGVIVPTIERFYWHNMQYHEDESIKGDLQVIARGSLSLVAKEQTQMRRQEFLQMTGNPVDAQIMGKEGRAALLRELAKGLDMNPEDLVPDDKELREQMMLEQQQAQQAEAPPQGAGEADPAGNRPQEGVPV